MCGQAADVWWSQTSDDVPTLAEALLDAGRPLSGAVVGLLRRSAHMGLGWVQLLLDRVPEPPLNPGEPWSDRVLAELPEPGGPWRELIPHVRAAGPTPGARWDRAAAAVLDGIDREAVRRTTTAWLALAAHGARDPWNLTAVRGLAWLLSSPSVPPCPDRPRPGPGRPCRTAPGHDRRRRCGHTRPGRLDGGVGRDELRRLAGCLDHAVTRKQILRALTP